MDQKNKIIKKIQDENYNLKKKLIKFDNINTNYQDNFSSKNRNKSNNNDNKILCLYVKLIIFFIMVIIINLLPQKKQIVNLKGLFTLRDHIECLSKNNNNNNKL